MALVKIGKAAEMLGVAAQTLLAWERSGELVPDRRSAGGTRYYDVGKIMGLGSEDMPTIGYARVSSHDQKNDLVSQSELLEAFCSAKGWRHEIISDLGSGLNYRKKGLNRLLAFLCQPEAICTRVISREPIKRYAVRVPTIEQSKRTGHNSEK